MPTRKPVTLVPSNTDSTGLPNSSTINVQQGGAAVAGEQAINFVSSSSVTFAITDNPTNGSVDVTATASGSGGGVTSFNGSTGAITYTPPQSTLIIQRAGTAIGTESALNFIAGSNILITAADNPTNNRVDVTIASTGAAVAQNTAYELNPNDANYLRIYALTVL